MPTAIEFDNVGKQYRLGLVSTQTLSHDLHRWWTVSVRGKEDPYLKIGETNDRSVKGSSDYVWALKDISFKVEQGDVVGIIGRNGAGKSTLLKLLSKVTGPTTGQIRARGRIGSLLEVGTGFHPEMTGRENIFMNGAILGMSKAEIASKLDEIVDFSGCERYLDTPVKRYSSGMMVRLGFAVAAHLDPEILVVDEVLAVGDAEFQKKAIGKMKDVSQGQGRTVLFVSHNMESMKMLCSHGVVLKNGSVEYMGEIDDAVTQYLCSASKALISESIFSEANRKDNRNFSRDVELIQGKIVGDVTDGFASDDPLEFRVKVKKNNPLLDSFQCNVVLTNLEGIQVAFYLSYPITLTGVDDEFWINVCIPNPSLPKGVYTVRFEASKQSFSKGVYPFDYIFDALSFEVKYVHRGKKDEFLFWRPSWGMTVHDGTDIHITIDK